jgi:uncharacterized membrane protein YvlD (DUF360 family)
LMKGENLLVATNSWSPTVLHLALSLVITGIVISIANCALTTLLARFTLPLYILLLFGLAMELAVLEESRCR